MEHIHKWLLEGDPWVAYRTRIELLNQSEDNKEVQKAWKQLTEHYLIKGLLAELQEWPGPILKTHKDAKHLTHKMAFIADLGFNQKDKAIKNIIPKILKHQSPEGPFQVLGNIPTHFGGSGKDEYLWMLCDAPTVLYSLIKFGLGENPQIKKALEYLLSLVRANGWPCASTESLGKKFRGPGRKDDPCPYANLLMLKVLALLPEWQTSEEAKTGIEAILSAWEKRQTKKYFLFGMGTDFKKLKAPFIWYDILHIVDVLTQFAWLHNDPRLQEMVKIITTKMDLNGFFMTESVWRAWKDWDFGQKKEPSRWITFLVYRIFKRLEENTP